MSMQNIEKFYAIAAADAAIVAQLVDGVETRDDFVARAVDVADQHGLSFTSDEANGWIDEQARIHGGGELSDAQLEEVAGGKNRKASKTAFDVMRGFMSATSIPGGMMAVASWVAEDVRS